MLNTTIRVHAQSFSIANPYQIVRALQCFSISCAFALNSLTILSARSFSDFPP